MNRRYIEVMAQAMVADDPLVLGALTHDEMRESAQAALTALIAELRNDPGAVEAMAGVHRDHEGTRAIHSINIRRLCDYLEQGS